jgi:hypothetical protein
METHAQDLVYRLLQLMPSPHLRASLQCLLALFLLAQRPRASDAATKSEAALSRFLNCYGWPTRKALQAIRQHSHRLIASYLKSSDLAASYANLMLRLGWERSQSTIPTPPAGDASEPTL